MKKCLAIVCLFLLCLSACSSSQETEPTGAIARFGSTPTIDGVFDSEEWDDAVIVKADTVELFRIKHDLRNLYFAVRAGGGDLVFDLDAGVRVLHWSAQLGSAEYAKYGTLEQVLDKPFEYELKGLKDESPAVIGDTLAEYLATNGWPSKATPKDSIGGGLPDTIRVDGSDFGRIWIDRNK